MMAATWSGAGALIPDDVERSRPVDVALGALQRDYMQVPRRCVPNAAILTTPPPKAVNWAESTGIRPIRPGTSGRAAGGLGLMLAG